MNQKFNINIGGVSHDYYIVETDAPKDYDGFGTFAICEVPNGDRFTKTGTNRKRNIMNNWTVNDRGLDIGGETIMLSHDKAEKLLIAHKSAIEKATEHRSQTRTVMIRHEHYTWQTERYRSGLHSVNQSHFATGDVALFLWRRVQGTTDLRVVRP